MIKLKGSELGWILNLAEKYHLSAGYKKHVKEFRLQKLDKFLGELLSRFHPNNFHAGNRRQVWFLVNKTELEEHLEKLYKAWQKQPYKLSCHTKAIEELKKFFDIEGKKI